MKKKEHSLSPLKLSFIWSLAGEIEVKVAEAKITEVKINEAREGYRTVAIRAALLYFILNDLNIINPIYQFSLKVCFLLGSNSTHSLYDRI